MLKSDNFFASILFMMILSLSACHMYKNNFPTNRLKLTEIRPMPKELKEVSGMVMVNDSTIICHNDGNNSPCIYLLDVKGKRPIQKYFLQNIVNTDWEAMTMTDSQIVVGDIGNNNGSRKDMKLIFFDNNFDNDNLTKSLRDSIKVKAKRISFLDQVDFLKSRSHNFDSESLVLYDEEVWIFTKNKGDQRTNYYFDTISNSQFQLVKRSSHNIKSMATDALYVEDKDCLLILSYTFGKGKFDCSLWAFRGFRERGFENCDIKEWKLDRSAQFESMCLSQDGVLYLANEEEILHNGVLFAVDIGEILQ